jgi:hypothetical protein
VKLFFATIGWTGTLLIVGAFFLNSVGVITPQDLIYPLMNIFGSLLFGIELWHRRSSSGITLQAVWIAVAGFNLWRIITA